MSKGKQEREQVKIGMPDIVLPRNCTAEIIPPGEAAFRFIVRVPMIEHVVSVYLNTQNSLGVMPWAYWEVYPGDEDGDPRQCAHDATASLSLSRMIARGVRFLITEHILATRDDVMFLACDAICKGSNVELKAFINKDGLGGWRVTIDGKLQEGHFPLRTVATIYAANVICGVW